MTSRRRFFSLQSEIFFHVWQKCCSSLADSTQQLSQHSAVSRSLDSLHEFTTQAHTERHVRTQISQLRVVGISGLFTTTGQITSTTPQPPQDQVTSLSERDLYLHPVKVTEEQEQEEKPPAQELPQEEQPTEN